MGKITTAVSMCLSLALYWHYSAALAEVEGERDKALAHVATVQAQLTAAIEERDEHKAMRDSAGASAWREVVRADELRQVLKQMLEDRWLSAQRAAQLCSGWNCGKLRVEAELWKGRFEDFNYRRRIFFD